MPLSPQSHPIPTHLPARPPDIRPHRSMDLPDARRRRPPPTDRATLRQTACDTPPPPLCRINSRRRCRRAVPALSSIQRAFECSSAALRVCLRRRPKRDPFIYALLSLKSFMFLNVATSTNIQCNIRPHLTNSSSIFPSPRRTTYVHHKCSGSSRSALEVFDFRSENALARARRASSLPFSAVVRPVEVSTTASIPSLSSTRPDRPTAHRPRCRRQSGRW